MNGDQEDTRDNFQSPLNAISDGLTKLVEDDTNTGKQLNGHIDAYLDRLAGRNQKLDLALNKLLKAPANVSKQYHQTRGRLDSRAFSRIKSGQVDAFKRSAYTSAKNSAVMLLSDISGSMSIDDNWAFAASLERTIGNILIKNNAPFSLVRYNDDTKVKKTFAQNMTSKQLANVTAGYGGDVCGGTDMSQAIVQGCDMFNKLGHSLSVTKRIMIVLTDGSCWRGADAVNASIDYALDHGIDYVFGIGLSTGLFQYSHFSATETVNDATTLQTLGLDMLVRAAA